MSINLDVSFAVFFFFIKQCFKENVKSFCLKLFNLIQIKFQYWEPIFTKRVKISKKSISTHGELDIVTEQNLFVLKFIFYLLSI